MRRLGVGWLSPPVYSCEGLSPRNPVSFPVRLSFHLPTMKSRKPQLMKTKLGFAAVVLLFATLGLPLSTAFATGTAFTYQGQLQNNGSPASGTYNLTFTLFNTYTGGVAVAGPLTNNAVGITNGLFTVLIDFGSSVWSGATNWLQIAVETNGGSAF